MGTELECVICQAYKSHSESNNGDIAFGILGLFALGYTFAQVEKELCFIHRRDMQVMVEEMSSLKPK